MAPAALTLFHYPLSPFSQKLRAMLGYAQLPWQSVRVKEMPPRPLLESLAGGYRKIPVAQIGADVFCDTRAIAAEVARRSGLRGLALERCGQAAQQQAGEGDRELLLACLVCANTLRMGRRMLASMPLLDIPRFLWDRVHLGRTASLETRLLRNPRQTVLRHAQQMQAQLQQRDFLFGAQPNHADFACYHGLWFLRDLGQSSLLNGLDRVNAWMDRIQAWGHGPHAEIDGAQALQAARLSRPRAIAAQHRVHPRIGTRVSVRPADYAQDATQGVLVGATRSLWIVAREAPSVGLVHVHFPQAGFVLA